MLLVEIDLHLPKTAKAKTKRRAKAKTKNSSIKCPAMCSPLRTAQRDLFLLPFTRIFKGFPFVALAK
jgi:hypothetical protein